MNIQTGVFTTVTSGYYIVTFSGTVDVQAGGYSNMYLYHNGVQVVESRVKSSMYVGNGDDWIGGQGSRTEKILNISI